jgi:hypothetical protein
MVCCVWYSTGSGSGTGGAAVAVAIAVIGATECVII